MYCFFGILNWQHCASEVLSVHIVKYNDILCAVNTTSCVCNVGLEISTSYLRLSLALNYII